MSKADTCSIPASLPPFMSSADKHVNFWKQVSGLCFIYIYEWLLFLRWASGSCPALWSIPWTDTGTDMEGWDGSTSQLAGLWKSREDLQIAVRQNAGKQRIQTGHQNSNKSFWNSQRRWVEESALTLFSLMDRHWFSQERSKNCQVLG